MPNSTQNQSVLLISNLYPNCLESTKGMFIKQLADSINKTNSVTVIAPLPFNPFEYFRKKSPIPLVEEIDGITVYHPRYLVIPKLFRSLTGYFFFYGIKRLVHKLKMENKADVISAHWVYPDGFGAMLVAKKYNIPISIHALGCDINEYTKYPLRKKRIIEALSRSDINIVKSRELKYKITELGISGDKTHVIHNGVDQEKFKHIDKINTRKELSLELNKRYVLFVGNFQIEKGLEYLIRAAKLIDDNSVHILIIGSGPLETQLHSLVKELGVSQKITFLGRVEHDLIPKYMGGVDLLCLPSLREGCPNVVLESLSCGTPVVASNVGAVPDIITQSHYGTIVQTQDPKAIAAAITKLLANKTSTKIDFDWYDWNKNAEKVSQLLLNI
jgi:glycosyltransferase involved in cell wall biosynthesis